MRIVRVEMYQEMSQKMRKAPTRAMPVTTDGVQWSPGMAWIGEINVRAAEGPRWVR